MLILKRVLVLFSSFVALLTLGVSQDADEYFRDKAYRQSRAKQWSEEFTKLNAQIPTLSPSEELWLKTEIEDTISEAGGKYTRRSLDAMNSREYQIRVAKPHVQEIIKVLDQIVSPPPQNDRQEVLLWTRLATLFIDTDFWLSIDDLVQRKIVQERINDLSELYYENHVLWAQQILRGFVLTYLNSMQ